VDQPFSLTEALDSILFSMKPKADLKGLTFQVEVREEGISAEVVGDQKTLIEILMRLSGNALKFTRNGGITIRASCEGMTADGLMVRFSVKDTGIGIPADYLKKLSHDFTQADGSRTRTFGGLGLGLTIVRTMVDLLGGKLIVESREGEGSVFHVLLTFAENIE
jgi:signal transduction histidine kinase